MTADEWEWASDYLRSRAEEYQHLILPLSTPRAIVSLLGSTPRGNKWFEEPLVVNVPFDGRGLDVRGLKSALLDLLMEALSISLEAQAVLDVEGEVQRLKDELKTDVGVE